jgi:hypothetical protein
VEQVYVELLQTLQTTAIEEMAMARYSLPESLVENLRFEMCCVEEGAEGFHYVQKEVEACEVL